MESVATTSKKMMVAIAMNDLVTEKPFDSIRVEDICQATGMSRSAFYRLFEDKYEIPLWSQKFALAAGIREIGRTLDVAEGNFVSMDGLLLFRELHKAVANLQGPRSLRTVSRAKHIAYMTETVRDMHRVAIDRELAFQIDNVAASQSDTVGRWLTGELDYDARELSQLVASCMPSRLFSILNEPVNPQKPQTLTLASLIASASRS